jgi:hypothetical protein
MFAFSVLSSYILLKLEVNTYFGDLMILTVTLNFTIGHMFMLPHTDAISTNSYSPLYMNNNKPGSGNNNAAGSSNNSGSSTNNLTNAPASINQSLENYNILNKDTNTRKARLRDSINRFNALMRDLNSCLSRKNQVEDRRRILASLSIVRQNILGKCAELAPISDARDRTLEQLKIQHTHYYSNLYSFRFKSHKLESANAILNDANKLANKKIN